MKTAIAALLAFTLAAIADAETAKVGALTMEIPPGFKAQMSHGKDSLGDLEVNRWRADDGQTLELLYYANFPKQDRGPMIVANEEEIEVADQKTKLIETKVFFGAEEKVLVVHLRSGKSIYIINAEHMPRDEFKALMPTVKIGEGKIDLSGTKSQRATAP